MRLFFLRRTDKENWEQYRSFVVRAENEEHARLMCVQKIETSDDRDITDPQFWLSDAITVDELEHDGDQGVIVFNYIGI